MTPGVSCRAAWREVHVGHWRRPSLVIGFVCCRMMFVGWGFRLRLLARTCAMMRDGVCTRVGMRCWCGGRWLWSAGIVCEMGYVRCTAVLVRRWRAESSGGVANRCRCCGRGAAAIDRKAAAWRTGHVADSVPYVQCVGVVLGLVSMCCSAAGGQWCCVSHHACESRWEQGGCPVSDCERPGAEMLKTHGWAAHSRTARCRIVSPITLVPGPVRCNMH